MITISHRRLLEIYLVHFEELSTARQAELNSLYLEHGRPIAEETLEEISYIERRVVEEGLGILAK